MSKDPAALLYIDKWLVSTKGMKAEVRGWYLNLILHQYDKGYLPNDLEELANFADVRISEYERFKQVWEQVLKQKFEQTPEGNLENAFAREILQKREQFLDKRILSGKIGYVIKYVKANFKVKSGILDRLKNDLDFDSLDIKNEQVLKQVLEQKIKLYINEDKDKDEGKNKIINETYKEATEFYFDVYKQLTGYTPKFESREGKSLKSVLNSLILSMTDKGIEINPTNLFNSFKALLNKLPKFYKDKIDINMIDNNYGKIIAEIGTKSGAGQQNTMQDILAERERRRQEAAASG